MVVLQEKMDEMKQQMLTIGIAADLANTVTDNIRFYERKGLLPSPQRSKGGYRLYTVEAVNRIRFIRRAKELGFSLKDIQELLDLSDNPRSC